MILALETSSALCAVCVLDETTGEALAEVSYDIGRGHAERLMDDVASALSRAGADYGGLTAIACGVGPGSFTGIRVAVAAARGFGLALNVPVHGVTTLQSVALLAKERATGKNILAVLDAGRDELHVQHFDPLARPVSQLRAMTRTQLVGQLPEGLFYVCGTGAQHLTARSGLEISLEPCIATAASAARASLDLAMTVPPKPLYLRAPDAKPQAGFAIARTGA